MLAHELKCFARSTPIEYPLDIPFSKHDVEEYYDIVIVHPLIKNIKNMSFRTWLLMKTEEKEDVLQERDYILKKFLGKEGWVEWKKTSSG